MIQPVKLDPAARDSICAQCHLTGAARIDRAGTQLAMYRPGEDLFRFVSVFVWAEGSTGGLRVNSHGEKLSYSRCRQASANAMWCGTCHDPHGEPEPDRRVAWYRTKCLGCHSVKLPAEHAARRDCTDCHMQRTQAEDGNHGVFTDHSIPRTPSEGGRLPRAIGRQLLPFGPSVADDRSLGLAYAEVALETNSAGHRKEAQRLLRRALPDSMDDWNLLTRLAFVEDAPEKALPLYERSLKLRTQQPVALVNAGILLAQRGELARAMEYWRRALAMNPGLTEASRNVATVLRAQGRAKEAREVMLRAAYFTPGVKP